MQQSVSGNNWQTGTAVTGPFSLNRLKEIGIDRAIENLRIGSKNSELIESDPNAVTEELLGKARYRVSGEWFKHCGRSERLLVFPACIGEFRYSNDPAGAE